MAEQILKVYRERLKLLQDWAAHFNEAGVGEEAVRKALVSPVGEALEEATAAVERLQTEASRGLEAVSELEWIRENRPSGAGQAPVRLEAAGYREKLAGAFLARCAGCTLGAPVELWPIERMEYLARQNGQAFPPVDYWHTCPPNPRKRYLSGRYFQYARRTMDHAPVDDDTTYTVLGLLIAEAHGKAFTTRDVGTEWKRLLPVACTAERVALDNLNAGISADRAASVGNPYCEWIGADIRADPWGYLAAGNPTFAAELAYRDAFLSHRRDGIYGAMFFAATISAAFVVDSPLQAVAVGLREIPGSSRLAEAVRWALATAPSIRDYREARAAVEARFPELSPVHTLNNACLTIFGLSIGGTDLTRVISQTVAMGLDNDCTAATAGSIAGAVAGRGNLSPHWTEPFRGRLATFLRGYELLDLEDLMERFRRQRDRFAEAGLGQ